MLGKTDGGHMQLIKARFAEEQATILTQLIRDHLRALITQIPLLFLRIHLPLLHVVRIALPIHILLQQNTLKIIIDWYVIA